MKQRMRGRNFKPTPEQRALVATLAGLKCTWEELRLLVLHDGKPITKACLHKHFRCELADGSAKVKALIGQKYVEAVQRGEQWAIKLGMRNRYGWSFEGGQPLPVEDFGASVSDDTIKITFVTPEKREPIDLNPHPDPQPNPYQNAAPDPTRPQIEPPRSTSIDPGYGLGPWRTDRDPKGWMK
jgi:hypothetical protein